MSFHLYHYLHVLRPSTLLYLVYVYVFTRSTVAINLAPAGLALSHCHAGTPHGVVRGAHAGVLGKLDNVEQTEDAWKDQGLDVFMSYVGEDDQASQPFSE